jgi:hypothetical protein
MNKHEKGIAPKKLTVEDLKKIIGGLGASILPHVSEDRNGTRVGPTFTGQG